MAERGSRAVQSRLTRALTFRAGDETPGDSLRRARRRSRRQGHCGPDDRYRPQLETTSGQPGYAARAPFRFGRELFAARAVVRVAPFALAAPQTVSMMRRVVTYGSAFAFGLRSSM